MKKKGSTRHSSRIKVVYLAPKPDEVVLNNVFELLFSKINES